MHATRIISIISVASIIKNIINDITNTSTINFGKDSKTAVPASAKDNRVLPKSAPAAGFWGEVFSFCYVLRSNPAFCRKK